MECVGFITPDNEVVVVVMNQGDNPVTFKLLDELSGGKQAVKMPWWLYHTQYRLTFILE